MPRRLAAWLLTLLLLTGLAVAQEPEPGTVPYQVEIVPTEDARLDAALAAVSQLVALREKAPTTALGILGRAQGDQRRLQTAFRSEGYYAGTARIELLGLPLNDPALVPRLEQARGPVAVRIVANPGPQYRIARIDIAPVNPAEQAALVAATTKPFGIAPGDPARAAPVLAAEETLRQRLLAAGHPLATVVGREYTVDFDSQTLTVAWKIAPGPFAVFAQPSVTGSDTVSQAFLERRAGRITGQPFSPERLEAERRDLAGLGPFGSVRVQAGTQLNAEGQLPVTFIVTDRPRHAVGINLAYETNYGPSIRVYWEDRNLFGSAERLRLEAEISRLLANGGLNQATYRIGATYRDPDPLRGRLGPEWSFLGSVFAVRELLKAYDRQAITLIPLLERRFSERLSATIGPVFDVGQTGAPGSPTDTWQRYEIVGLQMGLRYDTTDSLLDPAKGYRVVGTLMPAYSIQGSTPFAPLRATASTYWDVTGNRRSILAVRGTVGSLLGADRLDVPRHMRFYAGGGGSVRGYDYQSIGPRDAQGRITGGSSLVEGSLEWRQRVWGDVGMVAFVDAGSVGGGVAPSTGDLRVGAGLGARYYTPIGPIRADVALPLVKQQGSSGYGLYIGIGQAF